MSSLLKKVLSIFLLLIFCLMTAHSVGAEDLKTPEEYRKILSELGNQKKTLSSELQIIDTKTSITLSNIRVSEQKIVQTQSEIEKLSSKIDNLDSSLETLFKQLRQRAVKQYKIQQPSIFDLLFASDTIDALVKKIKYQKTAKQHSENLYIQAQLAKSSYEEQKIIREQKKQELDQLIKNLEAQRMELKTQQAQKQKTLVDTNNDETIYQSLLAQAEAQQKGFVSFVQTSGGDSIIAANSFGTGLDGAYYSQRDARWANQGIGYSSMSVLKVGCLLTSIAMFGKKNGENITPSDMASNPSRFYLSTAYMKNPWPGVAGKTYSELYGSRANISEELNNGNYVIVGISYSGGCYYGGDHFVLLTKKDGDDFIMHDPIYGPDLKFSSHYSTICSAATFK